MTRIRSVPTPETMYIPVATATPIPAMAQMLAAVVNPRTLKPLRRMVPAPRKVKLTLRQLCGTFMSEDRVSQWSQQLLGEA